MSRNEIDNLRASRVSALDREVPLPTYDEVVSSNCFPNFKDNVPQAQNSNIRDSTDDERVANQNNNEVEYNQRGDNSMKTKLLIVALGFVILPMCIMIVILQVKVCASPHAEAQRKYNELSTIHQSCIEENTLLRQRYEDLHKQYGQDRNSINTLNERITRLQKEVHELRSITLNANDSNSINPSAGSNSVRYLNSRSPVERRVNRKENPVTTHPMLDQILNKTMAYDETNKIKQSLTPG